MLRVIILTVCLAMVEINAGAQSPAYVLHGVDFSPYMTGQNPNFGSQISAAQISGRIGVIAPYTKWIRSFSTTHGLENIPPIGKQYGLKVAANAWISNNTAQNTLEIQALIAAANAGQVDIAIVGSEALLRNEVSESQLLAYMTQVRQAIPQSIPVTTADTYWTLLDHPSVLAASDVVFANFYPYWEGISAGNAVCALDKQYRQLVAAAGGKPVIVSETGWPSAGNAVGAAIPSASNAAQFFLQFVTWATSNNVPYFYFEAFDEDWKSGYEGPQGAHWGIWDSLGAMKPGMGAVFAGQTAPLACDGTIDGPGTPLLSLVFVPPYGFDLPLQGRVSHVSPASYGVAVYIKVAGGWWTKPTFAQPVTLILGDGTWSADVVTGGSDAQATEIAAFLIPSSFAPPQMAAAEPCPPACFHLPWIMCRSRERRIRSAELCWMPPLTLSPTSRSRTPPSALLRRPRMGGTPSITCRPPAMSR
ncbi:MAG: glycosyl hydrolase family 17 protein [Paludibaculum sp.]